MGKIQANINNAIVSLKKAQANIGNVIANMKKAQANIGGVIKTIWQSAFDFYSYGIEGVGWTPVNATKQSTYLYMNADSGGNATSGFKSDVFDISQYNKISFLFDAYIKKRNKYVSPKFSMEITDANNNIVLISSFVNGSTDGTTYIGEIKEFDTIDVNGSVYINIYVYAEGDYEFGVNEGWCKLYRVWGEE